MTSTSPVTSHCLSQHHDLHTTLGVEGVNTHILITLLIIFVFSIPFFLNLQSARSESKLPVANRMFFFEPRIFSRIRWAFRAKRILDSAHQKFSGQPYMLARGDMDIIVLPSEFINELNHLPANVINTREFHSQTLLGHLTGIDIVRKTSFHVKILLSRISPSIPILLAPIARRICAALTHRLPQDTESWVAVEPLDLTVKCVSEGVALLLYGSPTCDNPSLVRLCHELTKNVFTIVFVMRCVPSILQPILVWLLPQKWALSRCWRTLQQGIVPEINRRKQKSTFAVSPDVSVSPDVISWMIADGESELERDPKSLSQLIGALTAGATYSTASLVAGVIADLTARPELMKEVRKEIQAKHEEVGGKWDERAFNGLHKLDSVMKETSRLAPSSIVVYSRHMVADHTLSNGLTLKKGQRITVAPHFKSMSPEFFENPDQHKGLRHCNSEPFRKVDSTLLTWGSGRWACPGRFLANSIAKIMLVKLLDEYEFKFTDGKRPPNVAMHEFVLFYPFSKMLVRRRQECLEIQH